MAFPGIRMNLFKKKPAKPSFNVNHPDITPQVEVAFEAAGVKYYRFKEEFRIPAGRYKYIHNALREMDLRMTQAKLLEYVAEFENCLNGTGKKKEINLGRLWELVLNMKSRAKLPFDADTVKRFAAVTYFDDTEDLSTYDKAYGQRKIDLWDKHNVVDFFLTKPIGELLNLSNTSVEHLREYLTTSMEILEELNSGLLKASPENL
jgi:hypothetical protein